MLSGPLLQHVRLPLFFHTGIRTVCIDHPGKRKKMQVADTNCKLWQYNMENLLTRANLEDCSDSYGVLEGKFSAMLQIFLCGMLR